ncbi:MAG: thioredoxin family protein [Phycisphaerales bacterium]|nr:thioredoxin family protein [Phycisphaerales bacterium]
MQHRTWSAATLGLVLTASPLALAGPSDSEGIGGFGGLIPPVPQAQEPEFFDSRDRVDVHIVPQRTQVAPGGDIAIAIIFDQDERWHIHTNDPVVPPELGQPEDYYATAIYAESADGRLVPHTNWTQWPEVHEITVSFGATPVPYGVFEGRAIAYLPVTVPADASLGPASLIIRPFFQACDDRNCLAPTPMPPEPGEAADAMWTEYGTTITLDIVNVGSVSAAAASNDFAGFDGQIFAKIHEGAPPPDTSGHDVTFDVFGVVTFGLDTDSSLGLILLLIVAAIGGFLLNLTPCVLPVIPLKIMAISASAESRKRTLMLGISMSAGVVGFWIALGLAIAILTGFTASNQLFQYPWVSVALGLIIAAMAIGMCGLFAIRLPSAVYMVSPKHDTISGSFLFGIMTAILSTPCTAPLMGAAMAWAVTKPPAVTMVTFAAIGGGMGLPYLVLAAFPKLTDRMPKAGPASELIKQVMGLLMLAAAAYFVGVGMSGLMAEPPQPPSRLYWWVVASIVMAAGAWLTIKTWMLTAASAPGREMDAHQPTDFRGPKHAVALRIWVTGLGTFFVAAGIAMAISLTDQGPIKWVWYTPETLQEAFEDDKVVVMEFTAEWCLNCKALEETVLHADSIVTALDAADVEPIKVDLTGNNEAGNAMLAKVGRVQIPLLVVFAPDGREIWSNDYYTPDQVLDAIERARQ